MIKKDKKTGPFFGVRMKKPARKQPVDFSYESSRIINLRNPGFEEKDLPPKIRKTSTRKNTRRYRRSGALFWSSAAIGEINLEEKKTPSRDELLETLARIEEAETKLRLELASGIGETVSDLSEEAIAEEVMPLTPEEIISQFLIEPETDEVDGWLMEMDETASFFAEELKFSDFVVEEAAVLEKPKKIAGFSAGKKNIAELFNSIDPKIFIKPKEHPRKRVFSSLSRFWATGAKFAGAGMLIWLVIFGLSLAGRGFSAKENILSSALEAYEAMTSAADSATQFDFSSAQEDFGLAYQNFLAAQNELNKMGKTVIAVLEKLPGGSVVSSGSALLDAGENLAKAGQSFSQVAGLFLIGDWNVSFSGQGQPLTEKIVAARQEIGPAQKYLAQASESLGEVNLADLPENMRSVVGQLKEKLPVIVNSLDQVNLWSGAFLEILGHRQPKKYLLVFQNNSEIRATGGFIGTYGVLDLAGGQIKNLQVDGIFNLDGQLYEKIIPPKAIQKISTAWSTHDANWFADWPVSARKIMWFYEKAGGATADGAISLTPTVFERLLKITGPIDMPFYGVTLAAENFLDLTQYKVESDYDKKLNQPKKILADFAPLFLDKLWQVWPDRYQEIIAVLADALAEKHILFYFSDENLEKVFAQQGWGGEVLSTEKDYLMVVNTNINGFKTDKMIEQKIHHSAQVQSDGSIIDTVKITRTHRGGQSQYDWYNKVNADFLRLYLPLGSQLISAQGQTPENYISPIDYQAQGFKADAEVAAQEAGMTIDSNSGTQIFEESGKTVFGNWAYVSPGESVTVVYQYRLPFKLDLKAANTSYSLLAQKQSGSPGGEFISILQLPADSKINWQYPTDLKISGSQIKFISDLSIDKFYGLVLEN